MRFGPLDIRLRPEIKASGTWRALTTFYGGRQPVWTPKDYESFSREGYANNVPVYRCVNLISESCAGIPWKLYRKGRDGEKKQVKEHPLLDLLRRPNEEQGGAEFFKWTVGYLMLSGNTYVERVGPNAGPPKELHAQRPDRMQVVPGDSIQRVRGYVYKVNGQETPYPSEQILHYKLFNPLNDWYGMAPIEAASRSVDQNNSSRAWNVGLVQNSARPPGVYSLKDGATMDDDSYEDAQAQIKEHNSGPRNAGKSLLLDTGVDWKPTAYSPAEMDWTGGIKLSTREIAVAYNVPPEMVGDTETKTYASYGEARKSFYNETVLPLMDGLRDGLNNWLTPLFGDDLYLEYDRDDIEALREDQGEVWKRADGAADLTLNERRALKGYTPLPGGDVLLLPKTLQVLPAQEADLPAAALAARPAPAMLPAPGDGDKDAEAKKAAFLKRFSERANARRIEYERGERHV